MLPPELEAGDAFGPEVDHEGGFSVGAVAAQSAATGERDIHAVSSGVILLSLPLSLALSPLAGGASEPRGCGGATSSGERAADAPVVEVADAGHRLRRTAAAGRRPRSSRRPASGAWPPGITQVTASCIRIQRSANVAMRGLLRAPAGAAPRPPSRPISKGTPEKVSPRSNAAPSRLKLRWSSAANVLARVILPASIPDDSGSRARMPTLRRARLGEEQVGRPLAEDVVDDLHRLHAGVLDGLQRLLDPLDADAVEADLARPSPCRRGPRTPRAGSRRPCGGQCSCSRSMVVGLQVLEAALDEGGQVLAVVALDRLHGQPAPRLGGDVERLLALARAAAPAAARCGRRRRRRRCRRSSRRDRARGAAPPSTRRRRPRPRSRRSPRRRS